MLISSTRIESTGSDYQIKQDGRSEHSNYIKVSAMAVYITIISQVELSYIRNMEKRYKTGNFTLWIISMLPCCGA